jgi:hypothetical protein
MSEIEMWLFDHAANRARAARGELPVTGLWLWGGGETLRALPSVRGWAAGRDPLFVAFDVRTQFPTGSGGPRADAAASASAAPDANARGDGGGGVVVCSEAPGSAAWPRVERDWLVPAMAALQSGRISQLQLSAVDRCFRLTSPRHWRFWRRARPWWEWFEIEGNESHGSE